MMSEYRRANTKDGTYFFTVVTYRRQPFLCNERVRAALREGIKATQITNPFTIDAWVCCPTIFTQSGHYRLMMPVLVSVGR
jgi:putative transposase